MMSTTAGERLKQARTERQLMLRDVTRATKIQPWVLEALEANRLQETMSSIYVKSFLTEYAKFLQLDAREIVALALSSSATPSAEGISQPPMPESPLVPTQQPSEPVITWRLPNLWPAASRLAVLAASVLLLVGLVKLNPLQRLMAHIPRQEASLSLPNHANPVTATAEPSAWHVDAAQPLQLSVTAMRPTWVSVKADGKLLSQQQLAAGSKEQWEARRRFELVVGSPTKVDVSLNGKLITPRVLAHQGRLVITHNTIKALDDSTPAKKD